MPASIANTGRYSAIASQIYQDRQASLTSDYQQLNAAWNRTANLRLIAFAGLFGCVWWYWSSRWIGVVIIGIAVLAVTMWLVTLHARQRTERDGLNRLIQVNQRAIARLELRWSDLAEHPFSTTPASHPFARDLNITGHASLAQRIGTPATDSGWRALLSRLTQPEFDDPKSRQDAVRELANLLDTRQRIEACGNPVLQTPEELLDWVDSPETVELPVWLRWFSRISPLLAGVFVVSQLAGVFEWPLWLIPVAAQALVSQTIGLPFAREVRRIVPASSEMSGYAEIVNLITRSHASSPLLTDLQRQLNSPSASAGLGRLRRICSYTVPTSSLLYFPLQLSVLWDLHQYDALARWRAAHGVHVSGWLNAIAEWESLAALSVLAHDHPDWCFPVVSTSDQTIQASHLRHPLIPQDIAIGNDVEVGPAGHLLFVTGSNMSGKSTLLRAIGINSILAMAGAPVAASQCSLPPVDIHCCMRVEDSIEHGVSFFMAELLRLKAVVDAATRATSTPVLYLLDEILQGTNTAERQIASRQVLDALLDTHAIGAVSSHDLELIEDDRLLSRANSVHFSEYFDTATQPPVMKFDYVLRPGIATSTNALALMKMLGFSVQENDQRNLRWSNNREND